MTRAATTRSVPTPGEHLRLAAQLCFPLYATTNLVVRLYRPLLKPLGLTYPQYLVLLVLWERQAMTVRALGDELHLESGTLSPLLARLQRRGLVRKATDPLDARRVVVTLTARGQALRARALQVPEALLCRFVDGLGDSALAPSELIGLRDTLRGVLAAWQRNDRTTRRTHEQHDA